VKIAFITGSLAAGHDGVGDYARTLATACANCGHEVRLLALADREAATEGGSGQLQVRRMACEQTMVGGAAEAHRWLSDFAPGWASLQFVPYSFDPRGLFGRFIPELSQVMTVAPKRHIYFHEIWIGAQQGAPLKRRVIGLLQRRAVAKLLAAVGPQRIHTSTEFYLTALSHLGASAQRLPMFGSVPWLGPNPALPAIPGVAGGALVCGMFGTVHPDWQPDAFMADFATLAQRMGRSAALVSVGGMGPGAALFARLTDEWRGRVTCVALGRHSETELAQIFGRFDFAVTTVPWNILGKSSSAAALREHGIKVVGTHPGDPLRGSDALEDDIAQDEGFVPYFRDHSRLAEALQRTAPRPGAAMVAERLLASLQEVAS